MTFGQRFILTVTIIPASLFALALVGYLTGNWNADEELRPGYFLASAETRPEPPCMDEQMKEQIRAVMLEALDDALKEHVKHVFSIWLKDETGQPSRARTGVQQGIKAYMGARKNTLEWSPPPCSG